MQTAREVVKAAIEFTTPDRLPVIFDQLGVSDMHRVFWNQIGSGDWMEKHSQDLWHCGWTRTETHNMGQITVHPLDDWSKAKDFRWPDPDKPSNFEGVEEKFAGTEGKYVTTDIFMLLWERMQALRGFENVFTDLYLERENVEDLADRIVSFDIAIIKNMARRFPGKIDGLTFTDDWGTENALMIDPKIWRGFFRPRYEKIFRACHDAGWHVWMHCCGKVNEIIGDLIEIGCDVINLQQPRLLGIKEIGEQYAGKICFQATCDIQRTMPVKDIPEIREEAKLLLDSWGTEKGGFILCDYGDDAAIGCTAEKTQAMFDAFLHYDRWRAPK